MALVLLITMSVLVLLFDATQRLAGKKPYWDLNWRGQPVGPGLEIVGAIVIASVPILWLINRKRLDK